MRNHKIVHDSVHGSVRLEGVPLSLLEVPELQRLHSIHQLGLAYLVFPGANHTRFEHSLGTFAVARRICSAIGLEEEEALLVECAAFLHDVGHLPFSHTLEFVLHSQFGIDHTEISRRLIRGEDTVLSESDRMVLGRYRTIAELLEAGGVSPAQVAALLKGSVPAAGLQRTFPGPKRQTHFNSKRYLSQIVTGPVDADQLDYLKRDSHYTGVAYGVIDLDRLVETLEIFNGDLVVDKGGLSAVEGVLVARALMFSSVYMHKTVRISELMLAKAVEALGKEEVLRIHMLTDAGLLAHLESMGGYSAEIATMLKFRRLFKKAYSVRTTDMTEDAWDKVDTLSDFRRRRQVEDEIAHRTGLAPGEVIVDVPSSELSISEPRLPMTDLRVLDGGKVKMLSRLSSLSATLQTRKAYEWAVMVACPAKHRERVGKVSKKVLGL